MVPAPGGIGGMGLECEKGWRGWGNGRRRGMGGGGEGAKMQGDEVGLNAEGLCIGCQAGEMEVVKAHVVECVVDEGETVEGWTMHFGRSEGPKLAAPWSSTTFIYYCKPLR